MDVDVQVEGVSYNSDTNSTQQEEIKKPASALGASAEASAQRRLAKELARREKQSLKEEKKAKKQAMKEAKAAARAEKLAAKAAAKAEKAAAKKSKSSSSETNWDAIDDSQWKPATPSSIAQSVISCQECGAVNTSGTAYCSSCGAFL